MLTHTTILSRTVVVSVKTKKTVIARTQTDRVTVFFLTTSDRPTSSPRRAVVVTQTRAKYEGQRSQAGRNLRVETNGRTELIL